MDRLVGILRSENTLTVRWVRRSHTVDFDDCVAVLDAFDAARPPWHEFTDGPLMPAMHSALLADWNALCDVVTLDAGAVERVLARTVLGQPVFQPPVTPPVSPAPAKPTAAHPRAYAGTKYKPPKLKSPVAQDWRPSLCDPRSLESVAAEARLPDTFRTSLYPLVRDQSAAGMTEALALYWALRLNDNPEHLAVTAFLFSLHTQNSFDWCRLVVSQPPEHWTLLLTLVIESGAYAVVPQLSFSGILAEVLDGKDAPYRAYWLLHGLTTQGDPEYLLAGYRLADAYDETYVFHSAGRNGYFPLTTVLAWGDYCRDADDFYAGTLLHLWRQCGLRGGLGECLEKIDLPRLTTDAAWRFLKLLRGSFDNWGELNDDKADTKWAAVRPLMGDLIALVQSVPAVYQDKCVWHLIEYLEEWNSSAEIEANLPAAFTLTRRLCRPPFAEKNDLTFVTVDFLTHFPAPLRDQFLAAPDTSFKRLEQACRRDNDALLIGWGTWALTRHQAEFTVHCFESDPARLFHAAKRLGILPKPTRDVVVQTLTPLPDETPRVALKRLEDAVTAALAQGFSPDARPQTEPHALQIQQLIEDNRKALRKFLAAHWEGRTDYRQTHPLTHRWLAAHPALDLDKWQAGVTLGAETEMHTMLMLTTEQDPLEALKLGTYVGSCLGLGGAFTYSAAAVVLDINKQVVYARDKRGSVVGRQLVAIS